MRREIESRVRVPHLKLRDITPLPPGEAEREPEETSPGTACFICGKQKGPSVDYESIPGTGHLLMLEKPEEFNRLLLAFLAKQKF